MKQITQLTLNGAGPHDVLVPAGAVYLCVQCHHLLGRSVDQGESVGPEDPPNELTTTVIDLLAGDGAALAIKRFLILTVGDRVPIGARPVGSAMARDEHDGITPLGLIHIFVTDPEANP